MNHILRLLRQLDTLYHTGNLDTYEQCWQKAAARIETLFPGFTLAYAEIFNAGSDRYPCGGMRHVVAPKERGAM